MPSSSGPTAASLQQALASVPALVEELLSRVPKGFGQFYPREGQEAGSGGGGGGSSGAARPKEGEFIVNWGGR